MFDTRKNCDYSEELVSFVYDELEDDKLASFEIHIASCRSCASEVASFKMIHEEMVDWKSDFDELPSPQIVVPGLEVKDSQPGFFDKLVASLNFGFGKGAIGFASVLVIALVAVFGWMMVSNFSSEPEFASTQPTTQNEEAIAASLEEPKPTNTSDLPKSIATDAPAESVVASTAKVNRSSSEIRQEPAIKTRKKPVQAVTTATTVASNSEKPAPNKPEAKVDSNPKLENLDVGRLTADFVYDTTNTDDAAQVGFGDLLDEVAILND